MSYISQCNDNLSKQVHSNLKDNHLSSHKSTNTFSNLKNNNLCYDFNSNTDIINNKDNIQSIK